MRHDVQRINYVALTDTRVDLLTEADEENFKEIDWGNFSKARMKILVDRCVTLFRFKKLYGDVIVRFYIKTGIYRAQILVRMVKVLVTKKRTGEEDEETLTNAFCIEAVNSVDESNVVTHTVLELSPRRYLIDYLRAAINLVWENSKLVRIEYAKLSDAQLELVREEYASFGNAWSTKMDFAVGSATGNLWHEVSR